MHVQYSIPGRSHCTLWLNDRDYLSVQPHSLAPPAQGETALYVEYVIDGRVRGQCFMTPVSAMQLQLDLLRGKAWAKNWLILQLEGLARGAQKVSEIPVTYYQPRA